MDRSFALAIPRLGSGVLDHGVLRDRNRLEFAASTMIAALRRLELRAKSEIADLATRKRGFDRSFRASS